MKLFKKNNKPYFEFNYKIGEPVEVYEDGLWTLYEVKQHDSGEIYLEPFVYGLNL